MRKHHIRDPHRPLHKPDTRRIGGSPIIVGQADPPRPTVPPRILSGSDGLQNLLGHSAACIALSREGAIASCDCRTRPLEDPAIVIGMIVQYVRTSGYGKRPLPDLLLELLVRQLLHGDPACRMVANWLSELGILPSGILRGRLAR